MLVNKVRAATAAEKSTIKSKNILNQQLTEELHRPTVRKFRNCKVYSSFKGNIQGSALAEMQLISSYNKGNWFLLCH